MYLHLGKNVVVEKKDVVCVCDLDNASYSHITRAYLSRAEKAGEVINVCDDLPKAFVVCADEKGGQRLYLSQLASATLLKRAETMSLE
jgi:hypothetical protein